MSTTETDLSSNGSCDMLNDEYVAQVWPAILFLSLIMLIGVCGNLLVCAVFCSNLKKVNNLFILSLAVVDLISCTIGVSGGILNLRFKYSFGESWFCPTMRFFTSFSSLASTGILIAISVHRFKKICRPFGSQLTLKGSTVAICVCGTLTFFIVLPAAFLSGKRTVIIQGVVCSECFIADKYVGTTVQWTFSSCIFLIFLSGWLILIVMYSMVWKSLRVQKIYRRKKQTDLQLRLKIQHGLSSDDILASVTSQQGSCVVENKVNTSTSTSEYLTNGSKDLKMHESSQTGLECPSVTSVEESTLPTASDTHSFADPVRDDSATEPKSVLGKPNVSSQSPATSSNPNNIKKPAKSIRPSPVLDKTTLMMFLVTIVFIGSFLPYGCLITARAINTNGFRDLTGVQLAMYNLFLRSYFLNSVLNPFIYSFCVQEFRSESRRLLYRIGRPCR